MKFFTVQEIIKSILFSFITGVGFGCIYSASEVVFSSIRKIIYSLPAVFHSIPVFSKSFVETVVKQKSSTKFSRLSENIRDAIIFTFFGAVTLILMYLILDGIFRIYVIFILIAGFILSQKTIGSLFCRAFDFLFRFVYKILIYIEYLFLYPFYNVYSVIRALVKKIAGRISRYKINRRTDSLIKRKIMEINKNIC